MKKNLIYLLAFIFLLSFLFFWLKKDGERLFFSEKKPISSIVENEEQKEESFDNSIIEEDLSFSSGFDNEQLALSLERYFLGQERFSWQTKEGSWRHCTVENLEPENELFPFSVWVYCGEYLLEDGKWEELSGSSGPVKVDYPNELSYYNPSQFSHVAPRDGSYYSQDIKNIFSEEAQKSLAWIDIETILKANRQFVLKNYLAWGKIKEAINNCQVKQVFQAHSLQVEVNLKDGTEIKAVEPKIDEIMNLVTNANCKDVIMSTE